MTTSGPLFPIGSLVLVEENTERSPYRLPCGH